MGVDPSVAASCDPSTSLACLHQVATEWLYSVPEHVLEKHLGNEPSTPTHEAEQQSDDPRRSLIPRRVPLQVVSQHSFPRGLERHTAS